MALKLYPLGIQTFERIRREDKLYIDKTEYVYRMAHTSGVYFFLGRPRRFGKSLLVSTFQSYFEGKKDLFKGLAIEKLEEEWTEYPVLHFDMSGGKHMNPQQLEEYLGYRLKDEELKWGISSPANGSNNRLIDLVNAAYRKSGKQVVVLVDEYDAPMLDAAHEKEQLDELRNIMRNFYSPLKFCEAKLRFVFLTGITKFSQLSIFSELNNITNISMNDDYAGICGITKDELLTRMSADIDVLSKAMGMDRTQTIGRLKDNYDGYHFTSPSPDIYNPFSLLNAFADGKFGSYWFGSGTPTYLVKMLDKFGVKPSEIGRRQLKSSVFDAPTETMTDAVPLLYQSGYITIKDYNKMLDLYTLDIPNKEVRLGLMESLLPYYVNNKTPEATTMVAYLFYDIQNGDMDAALHRLQEFLSTIPYCDNTRFEGHYQQVFYIIFSLLGYYVDVEVRTPRGRVDIVLRTKTTLYVMELKLDKSAGEAMEQIDLKNYPERFALCGLPVVKVAVCFDSERCTIGDWEIIGC